ncbi:MAG: 16S rRNA (cytosine(1402)-N(4))-methyltransferase RsmH [Verrucomicrobiae bacterium]|nr:16S rRNA (cytosine(1402)-N(4))-methyltransferase RsmH [Verrucomicrobiae bacterium]
MTASCFHIPVMLDKVIEVLQPSPGKTWLDGTVGGGGHAEALLERSSPNGRLIGVEVDAHADAVAGLRGLEGELARGFGGLEGAHGGLAGLQARERLARFGDRVSLAQANFAEMRTVMNNFGIRAADGVLLDLGISASQIDSPDRGFSFLHDAPLDMRMDGRLPRTAADVLAQESAEDLARIFRRYGDEPRAREIAEAIVRERSRQPITRTRQLADLVVKIKGRGGRSMHPATLVFQALRVYVNDEIEQLKRGLAAAVDVCRPGGRIAVIAFESVSDRCVKNFLRQMSADCVCPPEFPECRCGQKRRVRLLQRKPWRPTPEEVALNPRARSARLRAAEKLEE